MDWKERGSSLDQMSLKLVDIKPYKKYFAGKPFLLERVEQEEYKCLSQTNTIYQLLFQMTFIVLILLLKKTETVT